MGSWLTKVTSVPGSTRRTPGSKHAFDMVTVSPWPSVLRSWWHPPPADAGHAHIVEAITIAAARPPRTSTLRIARPSRSGSSPATPAGPSGFPLLEGLVDLVLGFLAGLLGLALGLLELPLRLVDLALRLGAPVAGHLAGLLLDRALGVFQGAFGLVLLAPHGASFRVSPGTYPRAAADRHGAARIGLGGSPRKEDSTMRFVRIAIVVAAVAMIGVACGDGGGGGDGSGSTAPITMGGKEVPPSSVP